MARTFSSSEAVIVDATLGHGSGERILVRAPAVNNEKRRFGEFLSSPEGIATNILTDRLERLERCGLVERRQYADRPPREEYHPTARGWDLAPVLREMIRWGQRHVPGTAKRPPAEVSERARRMMQTEHP